MEVGAQNIFSLIMVKRQILKEAILLKLVTELKRLNST
jgi:hypothetical protein